MALEDFSSSHGEFGRRQTTFGETTEIAFIVMQEERWWRPGHHCLWKGCVGSAVVFNGLPHRGGRGGWRAHLRAKMVVLSGTYMDPQFL